MMDFWIASFASVFQSIVASMFNRCWTNCEAILVPCFEPFFELRFCIDAGSFFVTSPFREQVNCFINFSVILAPCSDDFGIILRYFFGIDFAIDFCIDFVDFQEPKMDP